MPAEDGEAIQLECRAAQTNVLCGTHDLSWRIGNAETNWGYWVRGRVRQADGVTPVRRFRVGGTDVDNARGEFNVEVYPQTGVVVVSAAGMVAERRDYAAERAHPCDVGTIVLSGGCARVRGRVVDSAGQPVQRSVALHNESRNIYASAMPRAYDGGYEFVEVDPGAYDVSVWLPGTNAEVRLHFTIGADEDKTLPDLIVDLPRADETTVRLLLPDGQPARYAFVELLLQATDAHGEVCGQFGGQRITWVVRCANRTYVTGTFSVPAGASFTQVVLRPAALLAGRVYREGRPWHRAWLKYYRAGLLHTVDARLFDNYFSLMGEEGEYEVVEQRSKLRTRVTLWRGAENVINVE